MTKQSCPRSRSRCLGVLDPKSYERTDAVRGRQLAQEEIELNKHKLKLELYASSNVRVWLVNCSRQLIAHQSCWLAYRPGWTWLAAAAWQVRQQASRAACRREAEAASDRTWALRRAAEAARLARDWEPRAQAPERRARRWARSSRSGRVRAEWPAAAARSRSRSRRRSAAHAAARAPGWLPPPDPAALLQVQVRDFATLDISTSYGMNKMWAYIERCLYYRVCFYWHSL